MMRGVLNGVLSLGNIRDVEKMCDRIISQTFGVATTTRLGQGRDRTRDSRTKTISHHDHEDLLAFLIAQAWELWLRYDQTDDGRGESTFTGYAVPQLRLRVVDWQRRKIGRLRPGRETRDNPGEWGVLSSDGLDPGELERVLGSGRRDDPADRLPAFSGLQRAGSGEARGLAGGGGRAAARRAS